ncbi:MAG: exonuclease domain-containing protein [Ferruginibacter sp.]
MEYAIIDIETTGGYAAAHGITEIAVYIHDGSRLVKKFETLVNPNQRIPRYITALTGISDEMVATAPSFEEIADTLMELLENRIFVAHNVNFDFSFVKHQLQHCGYELKNKKLCTVRLARRVFPGQPSYSLGNLCRALHISNESRHRAGGDAKATVQLFEYLLSQGADVHIQQMLKKTSSEQWLPLHLLKTEVEKLPSKPGVYYFHDNKDKIIYVGKAINLKKRVSSHFTNNDAERKRQNLVRNIHKISFRQCATELEAIVLESTEIKRLWPKFNYSQKQPLQKYGLYQFEDGRGYYRLAIDKKKKHLQPLYCFNMLHEGIVLLKKMAEEFELDEKLCFLNKIAFTDSDMEFIDAPPQYNGKVRRAIEALNEQLPTFAVIDDGLKADEKLCLLIERGSFWGMGYIPASTKIDSSNTLKELLHPYTDNDTIRNSIYSFADLNPEKKLLLK